MKTKKFFGMIFTLIMVFTSLTVFPMQVSATAGVPVSSIINGGLYYIRNTNSNKYLDVSGAGDQGSLVLQWGFSSNANQIWRVTSFTTQNGTFYRLSPFHRYENCAFNIWGGYTNDYTNIRIYNDSLSNPGGSSLWGIWYQGYTNGYPSFSLRCSENTNKAAVVYLASQDNGGEIIVFTYYGNPNDKWYFEEASTSEETKTDCQSKANWCWATCAAYLSNYNHDYHSGSYVSHYRNEVLINTNNLTDYIGYISGSESAYGLQRQAVIRKFGNDADHELEGGEGAKERIEGIIDDLCNATDLSTCIISSAGNWDGNVITNIKNKLASAPVWLCTRKSTSGGHSLLVKAYLSGYDEFYIFDPHYNQGRWVSTSDLFGASGFTFDFRQEIFYLWGAAYI